MSYIIEVAEQQSGMTVVDENEDLSELEYLSKLSIN
jgi:hypothetical protein